jgi:hypothetical protein
MNLPFEGDSFIKNELIKLRDRFGLTTCVETGTQYGSTALELCNIFNAVITIEVDLEYFKIASQRLYGTTGSCILGRSENFLPVLPDLDNVLYYLDAHGCEVGGSPLKKELEIIAGKKLKNICIAIHDFKVPGTGFGFDTYDYELCFEEIESYLKTIYPDGFNYHYNSEADGARRGIIYIYPIKQ